MKWPVATIGEVCEVVSGATPKTDKPEYWDGDVPWVTPKDLSQLGQKYLSDTQRHITKAGFKSCSARMLPVRSVLLSSRAPIGLVAINTLPVCTNQGFKSLVPRFDLVSPEFLFWWLKAREKQIRSKGRGATFKEVSKKIVEDLRIPLPPIEEQKRIVEILNKADVLRATRQATIAQLDTLTQSIFLDMFGDPATNPKEWPHPSLLAFLETAEVFVDGDWVESKDQDSDGDVRLIQLADIGDGIYLDKSSRFLTSDTARRLRCTPLRIGDILIARMPDPLGRACQFPGDARDAVTVVDVCIIRPGPKGPHPTWLMCCINTPGFRSLIAREATGTTRSRISRGNLSRLPVIAPPMALQQEFAYRLEAVTELRKKSVSAATQCNTLFASLQHRAFGGEL